MKTAIILNGVLLLVAAATTPSCPTPPPPNPPQPDASDAATLDVSADAPVDTCRRACYALAAISCKEGVDPVCPMKLSAIEHYRLNPNPARGNVPLTCADVAAVRSVADVHAIGQKCNGE